MNDDPPEDWRRWPPYAISFLTFLAIAVAFVVAANAALSLAVSRGVLPAMPAPAETEAAVDLAFGSPAKKLAVSIALNALVVTLIAFAATSSGLRSHQRVPHLVHRLRLRAPQWTEVAIAVLGLIGLTTALDSSVQLLGLHEVGALADIRDAIDPLPLSQRLVFAALIGIGPGVTEELFFRGYLLNRVAVAQGPRAGLVVSSLVFGLFHADLVHTPLAAIMGFYLGFCLLHTGSLWVPIAAHIANNAIAALTTGWTPNDLQAALLIPLGLTAGAAAITLLSRRERLFWHTVVW